LPGWRNQIRKVAVSAFQAKFLSLLDEVNSAWEAVLLHSKDASGCTTAFASGWPMRPLTSAKLLGGSQLSRPRTNCRFGGKTLPTSLGRRRPRPSG
jgi:hypothetical protein